MFDWENAIALDTMSNPYLQPHLSSRPKSIRVMKVFQQAMHLTEDWAALNTQLHLLLTM